MAGQVQPDLQMLVRPPPNPVCLVVPLSSPEVSRQRALVVTGTALPCPAAVAGRGSTTGPGALSRKWEEEVMLLTWGWGGGDQRKGLISRTYEENVNRDLILHHNYSGNV